MSTHTIADRYTVTGRIGAGGGGVVWQATDEVLGRTVAVKQVELPRHLAQDERDRSRTRALREARSAARLEHRSVVSIYDVLEGDDALHIVMEHIDAPSLATLVAGDGPLSPQRVATIGLDVLGGLEAAHAAGVVHRDIKPSNVLVSDTGPAVVTDFGIAAVLGESRITRTGQALGTPDYIAPEQLEDGPVGPPCDLWALGATLYEAVEGVPPFQRERTMATIHGVATADPRPPQRAGPLAPLLQDLLTKDPAGRPDVDAARRRLRSVQQAATAQEPTESREAPESGSIGTAAAVAPAAIDAPDTIDAPDAPSTPDTTETTDSQAPDTTAAAADDATEPVDGPTQPGAGPSGPAPVPAAPASDGSGPATSDLEPSGDRRRSALIVGGLLVVPALIAGVAMTSLGGDGAGDQPQDQRADASQAAAPDSDAPATTEPDAGADSASSTDAAEQNPDTAEESAPASDTGPAAPPNGWELYEGDTYAVAVPEGWEPRDAPGSAVDLVAPSGAAYLRAANTDDPAEAVLADTQRIRDSFRSRYGSYEEIALEPVEYRGHEAVRWEYTYAPDGRELRAVHLNFSTGERGYALNYQAPADDWDGLAGRFDDFTATFRQR